MTDHGAEGKSGQVRTVWLSRAFVLLLLIVVFGELRGVEAPVRWGSVLFLAAVLFLRVWALAPAAFLIFYLYLGTAWIAKTALWKLPSAPFVWALFITVLSCWIFPPVRKEFGWFRRGELDQITWGAVGLVSGISAVIFVLWAFSTNYLGASTLLLRTYDSAPYWWLLLLGIPFFATINAFVEEMVYRGIFLAALEKTWKNLWLVLGLQALAFSAVHYASGFPSGKFGFVLAFGYAMALGKIKQRSEGMLAPFLTHAISDTMIGLLLLFLLH